MSQAPSVPPSLYIGITQLLVLLSTDPLACSEQAVLPSVAEASRVASQEGGEVWARRICERQREEDEGGNCRKASERSWEEMVKTLCAVGGACMVLSRRSAALMVQEQARAASMPAIHAKCVRLLLQCPTLPVAAPLWAHVNVCQVVCCAADWGAWPCGYFFWAGCEMQFAV